jgi:hypothetical protein
LASLWIEVVGFEFDASAAQWVEKLRALADGIWLPEALTDSDDVSSTVRIASGVFTSTSGLASSMCERCWEQLQVRMPNYRFWKRLNQNAYEKLCRIRESEPPDWNERSQKNKTKSKFV